MVDYVVACSDAEKTIVKQWGYSLLVNTEHCTKYLSEHDNNCTGCISSLGCVKLACLSLNTALFIGGLIKEEKFEKNIDLIKHLQTVGEVKRFYN